MRLLVGAFFMSLCASTAWAEVSAEKPLTTTSTSEYKVELDEKVSRLQFGLYGQMTQFSSPNGSLQGYTLEAVLDYAIRDRYAAQFSLGQAVSSNGGVSVLYTGLRAGLGYSVIGSFVRRDSTLNINGQETVSVPSMDRPALIADLGIDQILFNGTSRIVPATGGSLGLRYDLELWHVRASAMLRYGQLLISAEQATMITAGVGLFLRF